MFSGHYETPTPDMYKAVLRDNESLRHDIERHIKIASELATENGALRAENERLLYDAGELATNLAEARATISRLREYAEHTTGCDSWAWPGGMKKPHAKCDCGYDELIRSLEEKP